MWPMLRLPIPPKGGRSPNSTNAPPRSAFAGTAMKSRPHRRHHARRSARPSCRRSSRAGSTRSTRPDAGRCSSSSPARCASACRRGSPRPRPPRSAARSRRRSSCSGPACAALSRAVRLARRPRRQAGRARDPAPFRPAMLAHAIEETDFRRARSRRLHGGMEMGRHPRAGGRRPRRRRQRRRRGFIRAPARTFRKAFPDLLEALRFDPAPSTANSW